MYKVSKLITTLNIGGMCPDTLSTSPWIHIHVRAKWCDIDNELDDNGDVGKQTPSSKMFNMR